VVPEIDGGDGLADDVPGVTASSWVRSASSESSYSGGERRPEIEAARVSMVSLFRFGIRPINYLSSCAGEREEEWDRRGGSGVP
jgi:hypothetical protein